jgi:6-methylsalicylate decarboxylase
LRLLQLATHGTVSRIAARRGRQNDRKEEGAETGTEVAGRRPVAIPHDDIFSHAGGTIPYLVTRFAIVDEMNVIPGAEERGTAADTLRRLYWDTALSWRPPVLHMLRSVVGMSQVLFGSDYPYLRRDLAVGCRHEVESSEELNREEAGAVLAGNALKLFPRLAAKMPKEKRAGR